MATACPTATTDAPTTRTAAEAEQGGRVGKSGPPHRQRSRGSRAALPKAAARSARLRRCPRQLLDALRLPATTPIAFGLNVLSVATMACAVVGCTSGAQTLEPSFGNIWWRTSWVPDHHIVWWSRPKTTAEWSAWLPTFVYSLVEPAADKRCHCQLKELYVRSTDRSRGAGRALMSWVAQYAFDNGCRRIDWPVKASNSRGIAFYEALGASRSLIG